MGKGALSAFLPDGHAQGENSDFCHMSCSSPEKQQWAKLAIVGV